LIAADTSTWIAFLQGQAGDDVHLLEAGLRDRQILIPPVVVTEILSDPNLTNDTVQEISAIPTLDLLPGFWLRAGALRARVLAKGRKARLGDALIAQSCLDAKVALLTRDRDFRSFALHAGLSLVQPR
jgi:predicted nucleic acid-binding protein